MGDFNAHIHELDGWEDGNERRLRSLVEDLQLEVVNLRETCEGHYTWCARYSRTCIDYCLVSQEIGRFLVQVHIDELGEHSFGSDHNRLKLEFSRATWKRMRERLSSFVRPYLTEDAAAIVADLFENSNERRNATGYSEYVTVSVAL